MKARRAARPRLGVRHILFAAIVLATLIAVLIGVRAGLGSVPTPQPIPTPTATSADPYASYSAIPTATPGCPKSGDLTPELRKYYFRQCP